MSDSDKRRWQETAQREPQQIIAAILDAVPARIFWKDRNSVYLGCNAPFARDAGFERPEQLIGKDDYQMGWRDQAEIYRADDRAVMESGRAKLLIDEPQTTPDGKTIRLLTSKVPLRDSNGEVFGMLGTYLDVTERARLQDQLAFSNLLHTTAMETAPDAIVVVDENARIISFNRNFIKLWDIPESLVEVGAAYEPVLTLMTERAADASAFLKGVAPSRKHSGEAVRAEIRLKDGQVFDGHQAPLRDKEQRHLGRIWFYRDATERERAAKQIESQNVLFEAALNNMAQGLLMYDPFGKLIVSNRRLAELVGVDWEKWAGAVRGTTVAETLQAAQALNGLAVTNLQQVLAEQRNLLDRREAGRIVIERADGRLFSAWLAPMRNGGLVVTLEDISEQRRSEEKISHLAHFDGLTDLPNRAYFYEELEKRLGRSPQKESFAVLSLDLDHFKSVNDTLGHPVGDRLLQVAAARMRGSVRESDLIARLGGDEFAVLLGAFKQPADATMLATRLIDALSAPFEIDGHQIVVGVSIGIALAPADGASADQLMRNADLALYRCKADGGSMYRFFEAQMDAIMQRRRAIELDLRKALVDSEFTLVYQPIVKLKDGGVSACEALIRWHSPERGWLEPREFIPVAEESGLIIPIGEWVLGRACADAMEWPNHIVVGVNVSPVQFKGPDFVKVVKGVLAKTGLPAHRLELEITELVLIEESETALAKLRQLKQLGVSIAMDDFGTGYSSLGYLRSFPFDRIKVDQSFIRDLTKNQESLAILRAVVGLGSSLNIVTTAEGVETRDQLDLLKREGCTDVQGYLFSRPIPAADMKGLLTSLEGKEQASA